MTREWRERDFTRPSRCPKCGEDVFFIRYNGGSVWVDPPLGPPWDKHGCFDKPNEPTRVFSAWSAKSAGLTKPELGIIKRIQTTELSSQSVVELELTDTTRASFILRWTPNDDSLAGSLVFISEPDAILLHPRYAEIPFHSFSRMPPAGSDGWYTCPRCKVSVRHGTGHEEHCRKHYKSTAAPATPAPGNSAAPVARQTDKAVPLWRQRMLRRRTVYSARPKSTPPIRPQTPSPTPVEKPKTSNKQPSDLESRIQQAMEKVASEAWQAIDSQLPPDERFMLVKREVSRLIKMLSPYVRRQVEHRFSSQKWSPLRARAPK